MAKILSKGHSCASELQSYPSQVYWCRNHDVCTSSGVGTKFTETSYCDFCEKVPCVQVELKSIKVNHPCAMECGKKVITCEQDECICEQIKHITSHQNCAKIVCDYNKKIMIIDTCKQEKCLGDIVLKMKEEGHSCGFIDYHNSVINWCERKSKCSHSICYHLGGVKPKLYDE